MLGISSRRTGDADLQQFLDGVDFFGVRRFGVQGRQDGCYEF